MLLAPLFEDLPPVCLQCAADVRIVAFVTETAPVQPPPIAPARGPPAWDDRRADPVPAWDALAQPGPEQLLDQQVQW
jgi:hypothetical protein